MIRSSFQVQRTSTVESFHLTNGQVFITHSITTDIAQLNKHPTLTEPLKRIPPMIFKSNVEDAAQVDYVSLFRSI